MKLEDIARLNQREPGCVASNTLFALVYEEDGKGYLRLRSPYFRNEQIVAAFRELGELMQGIGHPRFITLDTYEENAEGGRWRVAQELLRSLANQLRDTPSLIADQEWRNTYVRQLMSAVDHLHRRQLMMLDMSLSSVLVSGRSDRRLYLLPPCSPFLFAKNEIWKLPMPHLAEEMTNSMDVDRRADIFAIAQIIRKLYHYEGLPYELNSAVLKSCNGRADHRPQSIGEVERIIEQSKRRGKWFSALKWIGGIAVACFLIGWLMGEDGPQKTMQPSEMNPEAYNDSLYEERLRNEVESYLKDTTYLLQDTAYTLSEEMKAKQREQIKKTQEVFRREFARRAEPSVRRIYGKETFRSDSANYQQVVQAEGKKLQNLQIQLASQYGLETGTANNIAGQVIQELADRFLKEH